jgi:hypothetical protein
VNASCSNERIRIQRRNTAGFLNTANGYEALYNNTTGFFNTANGVQALYANTTGDSKTRPSVTVRSATTPPPSATRSWGLMLAPISPAMAMSVSDRASLARSASTTERISGMFLTQARLTTWV